MTNGSGVGFLVGIAAVSAVASGVGSAVNVAGKVCEGVFVTTGVEVPPSPFELQETKARLMITVPRRIRNVAIAHLLDS